MSTSLETYIHVAALIQPPGSRNRAAELSSTALGVLAGMAPATGRKRLSRANISSFQASDVVVCLLDTWTDLPTARVAGSDTDKPSETAGSATRKIANITVGKAILRGLRTGELGLVSNSLHLTQTEIAKWQTDLFEAANSNIYGIRLPGLPPVTTSDISSAPRATVRQKRVVQSSRVDESWILDCVDRSIMNPDISMAWDIALRGVDSESGCIAVNTEAEFVFLAKHFPKAINAVSHTSKYVCSTVVIAEKGADHLSAAHSWIVDRSISLSVSKACDFSPPAGWLGLGIQVTRRANGKRVRHGVLLAALMVRCLREM